MRSKWSTTLVYHDERQLELTALLLEECGEVVQVCGKILRHGLHSTHPVSGISNRELLHRELGDIVAAMQLLEREGIISIPEVRARARDKHRRVGPYLHANEPLQPFDPIAEWPL